MARVEIGGYGKEDLPELIRKAREKLKARRADGGISDLDLERAARDKRMSIGSGTGAALGTGAGIALTPFLGPAAIPVGGMLGQQAGSAVGYNWKPVQDTWKRGWDKVGDNVSAVKDWFPF